MINIINVVKIIGFIFLGILVFIVSFPLGSPFWQIVMLIYTLCGITFIAGSIQKNTVTKSLTNIIGIVIFGLLLAVVAILMPFGIPLTIIAVISYVLYRAFRRFKPKTVLMILGSVVGILLLYDVVIYNTVVKYQKSIN